MNRQLLALIITVFFVACSPDLAPGRQKVKDSLKDPESAQFRSERIAKAPAIFCGEVNSKNSMGGYVGFKRYIVTSGFVAFDGDETSVLLKDKGVNTEARDEKVRKQLLEMSKNGRRLTEDDALEVMLTAIFDEYWKKACTEN